ncbi:TIGR03009 domain-containing protein [Rubripirellula obstinata]|nr:TIGR03009 domain-containing protein [Rubripirellula obstinata]
MLVFLVSSSVVAQQAGTQQAGTQQAGTQQAGTQQAAAQNGNANAAGQAPFGAISPAAQQQLDQVLQNWQNQSNGTKTLDVKFLRFHYDAASAPLGVPANKSQGIIKYAAPDRGLIRVEQIVFYAGMVAAKPDFKPAADRFGEHWVCNGKQLIEFDRNAKECRIQDLPPGMQGKNIISSPLPFVFNLDAAQLKQRYWVRQTQAPAPDVILLEVWPKRGEDRAQYKMVQVALEAKTFQPKALVMYAPNFDAKLAPVWDHYEFQEVKRNSLADNFQRFVTRNFIPEKPPSDWKILREEFAVPEEPAAQQAEGPNGPAKR